MRPGAGEGTLLTPQFCKAASSGDEPALRTRASATGQIRLSRSDAGCLMPDPQRRYIKHPCLLGDIAGDETLGEGVAIEIKHRNELIRVYSALVDQQHAQLRIAILFDDEYVVVLGDEI